LFPFTNKLNRPFLAFASLRIAACGGTRVLLAVDVVVGFELEDVVVVGVAAVSSAFGVSDSSSARTESEEGAAKKN
jgi:hypothetical protein